MSFETKDSGKRVAFESGMVRDDAAGKTDFDLVFNGPMYDRWAELLTRGEVKYPPDADGLANWLKAEGEAELRRFRKSASRHFRQWRRGDTDEDHAAAIFFNVNGYEYVKSKLSQDNDDLNADFEHARETHRRFLAALPQDKVEVETFHGIPIDEPLAHRKFLEGCEPLTFQGHTIQWVPDLSEPVITGVDPACPEGDRSYIRVVALDPKLQGAADALTTVLNANLCKAEAKVELAPLIQKARDAAYASLWSNLEKSVWTATELPYASRTEPQDWAYPTRWERFKAWVKKLLRCGRDPAEHFDDCAW